MSSLNIRMHANACESFFRKKFRRQKQMNLEYMAIGTLLGILMSLLFFGVNRQSLGIDIESVNIPVLIVTNNNTPTAHNAAYAKHFGNSTLSFSINGLKYINNETIHIHQRLDLTDNKQMYMIKTKNKQPAPICSDASSNSSSQSVLSVDLKSNKWSFTNEDDIKLLRTSVGHKSSPTK